MKKIYFLALSCATLLGIASCDPGENMNQQVLSGYFTITGSYPNYKLISDLDGTIVYPSTENIYKVTDGEGFDNHKRAYLDVYFYEADVTTTNNVSVIRNAEIKNGSYLTESTAISKEEADKANITAPDSIFSINSIDRCWLAYGYLNAIFIADYSLDSLNKDKGIIPGVKLCVTNTADNAVTLTMLYNRHTDKNAKYSTSIFDYSFDISKLNIPGNDSVSVTFETQGQDKSTIKVPRTIFNYAQ